MLTSLPHTLIELTRKAVNLTFRSVCTRQRQTSKLFPGAECSLHQRGHREVDHTDDRLAIRPGKNTDAPLTPSSTRSEAQLCAWDLKGLVSKNPLKQS